VTLRPPILILDLKRLFATCKTYLQDIAEYLTALGSGGMNSVTPFDVNMLAPQGKATGLISFYRVAAFMLVFFCTGHTIGGMLLQKSLGPEADAVFSSMKAVEFKFNGTTCTWYGFWFGFGLTASIFLSLSAVTAWQLENIPPEAWHLTSGIAWALVAAHLLNTILTWAYCFTGAGLLSTVVTILLAAGALQKQSRAAPAPSQKKL
jgi:hypothetical protein